MDLHHLLLSFPMLRRSAKELHNKEFDNEDGRWFYAVDLPDCHEEASTINSLALVHTTKTESNVDLNDQTH